MSANIETLAAKMPTVEKLPDTLFHFRYRGVSNLRMNLMYDYEDKTDVSVSVKRKTLDLVGVRMDPEGVIHLPKKYETDFEALMKVLKPEEKGTKPGCLKFLYIEPVSYKDPTLVAKYPLDEAPVTFRLDVSRKNFRTFTYTKPLVVPVVEDQPDKARQVARKAGQTVRGAVSGLIRAGSNTVGAGASAGRGFIEGLGSSTTSKKVEPKPAKAATEPAAKISPIELVAGAKTKKAVAPLELISEEPVEPVPPRTEAEDEVPSDQDGEDRGTVETQFTQGSGV